MNGNINVSKYQNVILYLISHMEDRTIRGKKKLAKLLYYVDFDRFEYKESMTTITGDEYRHRPMGPVPDSFEQILEGMRKQGLVSMTIEPSSNPRFHPTTIYTSDTPTDMRVFDEDDMRILRRVIKHYGDLNGTQLERRSHEEAPWRAVEERESIPFELAFYRGTDFSDAD